MLLLVVCADGVRCRTQELGAGKVTFYHAGIESPEQKRANHEAWSQNKAQVICATVAFGMGINKPDVRFVIHNSMPKSLTHYYQVRLARKLLVALRFTWTVRAGIWPCWPRRLSCALYLVLLLG